MRRECRECFARHRLQKKPLVSNPGMHHGTCVTHVTWCMSGSLTRGGGGKFPAFPRMRNAQFYVFGNRPMEVGFPLLWHWGHQSQDLNHRCADNLWYLYRDNECIIYKYMTCSHIKRVRFFFISLQCPRSTQWKVSSVLSISQSCCFLEMFVHVGLLKWCLC